MSVWILSTGEYSGYDYTLYEGPDPDLIERAMLDKIRAEYENRWQAETGNAGGYKGVWGDPKTPYVAIQDDYKAYLVEVLGLVEIKPQPPEINCGAYAKLGTYSRVTKEEREKA